MVGRPTEDVISILGTGVDGAIRRLVTAYDTAGRPYLFTSYDASSGGSVVNEVRRDYNGLGQHTVEYQAHAGAVDTGTTPKVQYAYSMMASGVNHSRLTTLTYPNGRVLNYNYATGLADTVSRLSSLSNGGTTYEQYSYLGQATAVKRTRPNGPNEIGLTYLEQTGDPTCVPGLPPCDGGDQYRGLDRFGRVVDHRFLDSSAVTDPLVRFRYGYDRNGNRLYRENLSGLVPNHDFDELYHANGPSNGADNFNQLAEFRRGPLTDGSVPTDGVADTVLDAVLKYRQTWTLDTQGNWDSVETFNGTSTSTETRTHNKQNQVTTVSGQTSPAYDNNGAMTTDQTNKTLIYDAWGRLVQVKQSTTVLATYRYDALNRRVTEADNGPAKDFYYSEQWQLLEERRTGTAYAQYVWSPVYVDALILRDRDANGQTGDGLEERLYAIQDANWNVVAVTNPSGAVQERYAYEPYGKHTRLSANWGTPGSDTINWVYLHQGGRYESVTGLYYFRDRDLSPALGRWNRQDPMGFEAGDTNLYRYERNAPPSYTDPSGLIGIFLGGAGQQPGDTDSTIFRLSTEYSKHNGPAQFIATPGPFEFRHAAGRRVNQIARFVEVHLQSSPCEPVDVFGFSRGAVYGVMLTVALQGRRIDVRFLGLIDPVSTHVTDAPFPLTVPTNVWDVWQGIKNPAGPAGGIWTTAEVVRAGGGEIPTRRYTRRDVNLGPLAAPLFHHLRMDDARADRAAIVMVNLKQAAAQAGVRWDPP